MVEQGQMRIEDVALGRVVLAAQGVEPRLILPSEQRRDDQRRSMLVRRHQRSAHKDSDFDLAAELDHAVGRQAEELHRGRRVAHHPGEQLLAP